MNVTHDMSVLSLITGASVLVQLVMAGLLLCSLFSWYYIFVKVFTFRRATQQSEQFEKDFWSGGDLNELFQRAVNSRESAGTMERLFESGFREYTKLRKQSGHNIAAVMDGTRRAMRATYQREMEGLESHLSFLASVGSVSPYVGLFGTVWGIMNSFRGLANVAQATLGTVAPGIAEALIATAAALAVAIPATFGYNIFANKLNRFDGALEGFGSEIIALMAREGRI